MIILQPTGDHGVDKGLTEIILHLIRTLHFENWLPQVHMLLVCQMLPK
jgi:hypothetical protein